MLFGSDMVGIIWSVECLWQLAAVLILVVGKMWCENIEARHRE